MSIKYVIISNTGVDVWEKEISAVDAGRWDVNFFFLEFHAGPKFLKSSK